MSSRTLWGGGKLYSPEVVVGLLELWGVEVKGLSVSAVSRLSRKGNELFYFSVVGPVAVMDSLDTKRETLKTRGWRVGWGDGIAGQGNGRRGRNPAPRI